MVGIAQLVEHLVVVQDVAGSSPVTHPKEEDHRVYSCGPTTPGSQTFIVEYPKEEDHRVYSCGPTTPGSQACSTQSGPKNRLALSPNTQSGPGKHLALFFCLNHLGQCFSLGVARRSGAR